MRNSDEGEEGGVDATGVFTADGAGGFERVDGGVGDGAESVVGGADFWVAEAGGGAEEVDGLFVFVDEAIEAVDVADMFWGGEDRDAGGGFDFIPAGGDGADEFVSGGVVDAAGVDDRARDENCTGDDNKDRGSNDGEFEDYPALVVGDRSGGFWFRCVFSRLDWRRSGFWLCDIYGVHRWLSMQ